MLALSLLIGLVKWPYQVLVVELEQDREAEWLGKLSHLGGLSSGVESRSPALCASVLLAGTGVLVNPRAA